MTEQQHIINTLQQLLRDGDELDRCCACRALGLLGNTFNVQTEVAHALTPHLHDDDIDVCVDAAESLGLLGDVAAVGHLIETLHHAPDGDVKVAVIEALGRIGGEQATAELIKCVTDSGEDLDWDDDEGWDSEWDCQRKAIQALGNLQVNAAIAPLAALLDEEDCPVDETDIVLALARIGGDGEQHVIQRLHNGSVRERRRAAYALGQACSRHAARALGRALQDPEPEVRIVATEALARNGLDQYLGALLLLLRDPDDGVRQTVLHAILKRSNKLSGNRVTKKLLPLLSDRSACVRATVLQALQGRLPEIISGDIQQQIQHLLTDSEPLVAAAAIPHTPALNIPDIEATLCALLDNKQLDVRIRQSAALTLAQCSDVSSDTLLALNRAIYDEMLTLRWVALQALMTLHKNQPGYSNETFPLFVATTNNIEKKNHKNNGNEKPITPFMLILATLRGEIIAAEIPNNVIESAVENSIESATEDAIKTKEADSTESHETEAHAEKETAAATSTLDAIRQTNLKYNPKDKARNTLAIDDIPAINKKEFEAFQEYYSLLDQQRQKRNKFYRPGSHDVRLLSTRILGGCSQSEAVKALQEVMHDENPDIQQEAVNALAQIALNTPGLKETLGTICSFLSLGSADLQITSARTLGAIGGIDNLHNLQECLLDTNPLLRSQSAAAISQLLERYVEIPARTPKNNTKLQTSSPRQKKENTRITSALLDLSTCLTDNNIGVRKAAALSLKKLSKLAEHKNIQEPIIDRLITAAFLGEGEQARDMGQALCRINHLAASKTLRNLLDALPSSQERRFTLEMLEEIFHPRQLAKNQSIKKEPA